MYFEVFIQNVSGWRWVRDSQHLAQQEIRDLQSQLVEERVRRQEAEVLFISR